MAATTMLQRLSALANPTRFSALAGRILPWAWGLAAVLFVVGLVLGFTSPPDARQGDMVRLLYIHPPTAWIAMLAFGLMAVAALGTLVFKHPLADVAAKAAAPIGAAFTLVGLITGALWGRPTWGTFWVWDGRLTSFLILFFIYLGIIALWHMMEDQVRAGRVVAILTLVGSVNLPIIRYSVEWWSTLHQPASLDLGGSAIDGALLTPMLVMLLAFTVLFVALHLTAMRNEILRRRVRTMRLLAADQAR
jgi:heme exporter protein C